MLGIPKSEIFVDEFSKQKTFSEVLKLLNEKLEKYGEVNVLIAGASCSGKTILANFLERKFLSTHIVTRINQDWYLKDKKDMVRSVEGFYMPDSLFSYYDSEFVDDTKRLINIGETLVPEYDFESKKRVSKTQLVKKGTIQIFEGLHVIRLLEKLPNSVKVYLDTEEEICLSRKIKREFEKHKIFPSRTVILWEDMTKPMFERFIECQKKKTDVIVKTDKFGKMFLKMDE